MSPRFLKTRIPVANQERVNKLKDQLGRELEDEEMDLSYAEIIIDLQYVEAVRESYRDENRLDNEAVIIANGEQYFIQTPYAQVVDQWIRANSGETQESPPSQDVGHAVKVLAQALDKDKDNPGSLFFGYQSNIAIAMIQAFDRTYLDKKKMPVIPSELHSIANEGAKLFLNFLIDSIK